MELKGSPPKPEGLSSSDCTSDPEEEEVSDEDDDDRNHKHRRRETSQSLEKDSFESTFTRPYRRHSKQFEIGHPFQENDTQASETWKNYNLGPIEKYATKFDKRRSGPGSLSRLPQELNHRINPSQMFFGDPGPVRGRGRDPGIWNQRDSRFNSVDIASQMVQQGPISSGLFSGRGLPSVSNTQTTSWNAFGLIPGMPNGAIDALHPITLQGSFRPAVNPSLNMGIPRQRCRDFEERGFCLRGDMCPMEHGINRIVVDDVQSLSQFNLPVSLPSGHLLGISTGPGALPTVGTSSTTMMNSKGVQSKISKSGIVDETVSLNDAYSTSASLGGAELYDPDQPLWNKSIPETSSPVLPLHSPKNDNTGALMGVDPSGRHHFKEFDGVDADFPAKNTRNDAGSHTSSTVWGRIRSSKNRLGVKDKTDQTVSTSCMENGPKEDQDGSGISWLGKRIISKDGGQKYMDLPAKKPNESLHNMHRPPQKALRTLFVNGIPQKGNKRESLLSHFQKFGEVIDIYIPLNSERAFVQFSKREEAEAALRAPDAVMGNRFIKLRWANRDNIPDEGVSSSSSVPIPPRGLGTASIQHHSSTNRGRDSSQATASMNTTAPPADPSLTAADHSKPVMTNGPITPPVQKKLETLEQLKEELRKKQELLDQKRNDFRRQLNKLEKQATGVKGELVAEPAAKRHKLGNAADSAKDTVPRSSDSVPTAVLPHTESSLERNKSADNVVLFSPKANATMGLQESLGSKQPVRSFAPAGHPFTVNRYKLDNRPTTFRILPPLPSGLTNIVALKEHFSSYGELFTVELEDVEPCDDIDESESESLRSRSARVTFTTRLSAERAFSNGKFWEGNNLQFMWVQLSTQNKDHDGRENSVAAPKGPKKVDTEPAEGTTQMDLKEACASGNEEHQHPERDGEMDLTELREVPKPCSTSVSGERSPKQEEPSRSAVSGEEGSLPSLVAISGEKE
ncbi:hypothetical protein K2173_020071 [Erythroxylum novogranatense]|uniref:Zinc finger CCCH domain-containing protein 41 n=1 Tax=Erythroxylum novogranatense TaxID=1862640 RepID=A0AAV8U6W0_9ROSI|nr:hypothetical protein K2173_020071 [Erythroxylum novogranatense]